MIKLYHGSNISIGQINLSIGRKGKDFGQGFYLSPDLQQARRMAQIAVEREGFGKPMVTVYGPIANDRVGVQVQRYMQRYIDVERLVEELKFITPTFQYFFGTEEAIRLLQKI